MKILIPLFLTFLFAFNSYSQQEVTISNDQFKTFKKGLPKGIKARFDRFEGTIWITGGKLTYGSAAKSHIDFYIGIINGRCILRFRNTYYSTKWLFCTEQTFLFGNKNKTQTLFKFKFDDDKREVLSGSNIKETSDLIVDGSVQKMIDFILTTEDKTFLIKFSGDGKYNTIGGFTKGLKKHVELIIEAYEYSKKYAAENFK